MNNKSHKLIIRFSFLIILFYYAGITLFIEKFHNHENRLKCHDNCPACNWARQLQDTNQTISAAQVCEQMHQTFVHDVYIPEDCSDFPSVLLSNPVPRAPPVL